MNTDADAKLGVGATLTEVFKRYRDHAGPLLTIAAVVFLPLALITELVSQESSVTGMSVSLALSGPAAFLYAAILAPIVTESRSTLNDSPLKLWSEASPALSKLLLGGILYALGTTAGVMLFIVPGLFLVTIWAVAPAVIRLEGLGAAASLARSRQIVRGNGWPVFSLVLLIILLVLAGSILLQVMAIGIAGEATGAFVGSWLGVVVAAPALGLLPTVLYSRLNTEDPAETPSPEAGT